MCRDPIPYHTSRLSGEMWVQAVLTGHPDCICCEFGMSKEVFVELVEELQGIGHKNSKFVTLGEQLAIFLYTCVTGLTGMLANDFSDQMI
ncbi:hypothetical protein F5J12DRAFT_725491 [Pisolithus orientalis]|uniref:uncharacterized protein n=1 Tax=Pisolithus orientalis TaxID=936130 RepID=UPI002224A3B6|nr:uncharacterized protein F5J12DRAFT_725491 [Pisolithus orientalis]KAI5996897.1 hypothetical protein F5J12DRAFT_725491 [Pisolithus orientalis]